MKDFGRFLKNIFVKNFPLKLLAVVLAALVVVLINF